MFYKKNRKKVVLPKDGTTLEVCTKTCFCKDCTDEKCLRAGEMVSDCPKYVCDNEDADCENCTFLKDYYAEMEKGGKG